MSGIQCGFAQNPYTPANPSELFQDGYGFRLKPAEDIETELYVKAAVFQTDTQERFAILSLDVCGMNQPLYDALCAQIEDMTGMDRSQFALCATHTHAGPACKVLDVLPIHGDFWMNTAVICGKTLLEAIENLRPCQVGSAIAEQPLTGSYNRRGRPVIDRRVKAAVFTDNTGRVIGGICSACCHPVLNTSYHISADYPSVLTEKAQKEYGVPFLFLQGRGADINPKPDKSITYLQAIQRLGDEVCARVFEASDAAGRETVPAKGLRWAYERVDIPVLPLAQAEQYHEAAAAQRKIIREHPDPAARHYALAQLQWDVAMEKAAGGSHVPTTYQVPLQAAVIGGLVFAFLPFELLTLTGNKIEERLVQKGFSAESIFVIGYANSVNSYLPPVEEFPFGGYEVSGATQWYGLYLYGQEAEPAVIENIMGLMDKIIRQ